MRPVLAGVGEVVQRPETAEPEGPLGLMVAAARRAQADSEAKRSLLERAGCVAVVNILSWRHPDPGRELARALGIDPARTLTTTIGGNSTQLLVSELSAEIAAGRLDCALIAGAEALHSGRLKEGKQPWEDPAGESAAAVIGDDRLGSSPEEIAHQASIPTQVYPLFETALRAAAGRSVPDHQRHLGRLYARLAAVAPTREAAWSPPPVGGYSATEIAESGPGNRMVAFPYTKRMCANIRVDQGAALILCSEAAARDAGAPAERLVYVLAGADAHDHFFVSERDALSASPALAATTADALAAAGLGVDDIARFDLYSCFPSAVELAMGALGLADNDGRPISLTGGLSFFGGPANNYVAHSIAAMVEACRADPGSVGMVTGLGWYATKHSVGLYSTRPPGGDYVRVDPATTQTRVDALPSRISAGAYTGAATLEASAVTFDRDGAPALAVVTALTAEGRRVWANTTEGGVMASLVSEEWAGRPVSVRSEGDVNRL